MEFYTADMMSIAETPIIETLSKTPEQIQCILATGPNSSDVLHVAYNPINQRIVAEKAVGNQIEFTVFKDPYISLDDVLISIGVGLPFVGMMWHDPTFTIENDMDNFTKRCVRSMPSCQVVVSDMWNARHLFDLD